MNFEEDFKRWAETKGLELYPSSESMDSFARFPGEKGPIPELRTWGGKEWDPALEGIVHEGDKAANAWFGLSLYLPHLVSAYGGYGLKPKDGGLQVPRERGIGSTDIAGLKPKPKSEALLPKESFSDKKFYADRTPEKFKPNGLNPITEDTLLDVSSRVKKETRKINDFFNTEQLFPIMEKWGFRPEILDSIKDIDIYLAHPEHPIMKGHGAAYYQPGWADQPPYIAAKARLSSDKGSMYRNVLHEIIHAAQQEQGEKIIDPKYRIKFKSTPAIKDEAWVRKYYREIPEEYDAQMNAARITRDFLNAERGHRRELETWEKIWRSIQENMIGPKID